jgi:hypothetical protein
LAAILKFKMDAIIKSTNINNNARNLFLVHNYIGLATKIKCMCRLEAGGCMVIQILKAGVSSQTMPGGFAQTLPGVYAQILLGGKVMLF